MTVKINADTSDGLKFVSDTSGTVDIQSNGTTKMSVTSSDITAPEGVNIKIHGSNSAGTQAGLWLRDLPRVTNDTSTFEHTYINSNNSIFFTKGSSATTSGFEGYNGSEWGSIGGGAGATGSGGDEVFVENERVVTTSYTLSTNKSAMCVGPLTINTGVTVTIPSGERLVIL